MFTHKLDESRSICLPVSRKSLQVLKDGVDAVFGEERDRVFGVLVEVGVEDALIHKVCIGTYIEEDPAKVVKLEYFKGIGQTCDCFFDFLTVAADDLFSTGNDFGDN